MLIPVGYSPPLFTHSGPHHASFYPFGAPLRLFTHLSLLFTHSGAHPFNLPSSGFFLHSRDPTPSVFTHLSLLFTHPFCFYPPLPSFYPLGTPPFLFLPTSPFFLPTRDPTLSVFTHLSLLFTHSGPHPFCFYPLGTPPFLFLPTSPFFLPTRDPTLSVFTHLSLLFTPSRLHPFNLPARSFFLPSQGPHPSPHPLLSETD